MNTKPNSTKHRLVWLALFVTLGHCWWFREHLVDDAFITMRYAQNWLAGQGVVFNPGEAVEGYTSPLWLLLLSAGAWVGFDMPTWSMVLGGGFVLGCVALLGWVPWPGVSPRERGWAALFLASSGCFVAWGTSGLEPALFAFLMLVSLGLHHGSDRTPSRDLLLSVSLGLCVLARPEGFLLFGLVQLSRMWRARGRDLPWSSEWAFLAPFLLIVAGHILWRRSYYGFPLPNTFYAKVGSSTDQVERGLGYLLDFATYYGPLLLAALFAWRRPIARAMGPVVLGFLAYIALVGGDNFPLFRFVAPVLPLLCLLAAVALGRLPRGSLTPVLGGLLCLATLWPSGKGEPWRTIQHDIGDVRVWSELGRWLNENLEPEDSIALNPVGAVGYHCDRVLIDMLGINDAHIAHQSMELGAGTPGHEKADGRYVLGRQPTLIFLGANHPLPPGMAEPRLFPMYPSDHQLLSIPEIEALYRPEVIEAGDLRFACLRRREAVGDSTRD